MKAAKKISVHVAAVPAEYHTVTPYLIVRDVSRAIEFYKKAFGATEHVRLEGPDGKSIMHAEIEIEGSRIFLGGEHHETGCKSPESLGGSPVSIHLYVEDVDAVFDRAVQSGAKPIMPVADMFWGDRYGKIADPFGHEWSLATHQEDVPPEEVRRRADSFFKAPPGGAKP
jgi:PhnB protein